MTATRCPGLPFCLGLVVAGIELVVTGFLLVFSLVPSGRFVPDWLRWAIVVAPAVDWAHVSVVPSTLPMQPVVNPVGLAVLVAGTAGIIAAQTYRWHDTGSPCDGTSGTFVRRP